MSDEHSLWTEHDSFPSHRFHAQDPDPSVLIDLIAFLQMPFLVTTCLPILSTMFSVFSYPFDALITARGFVCLHECNSGPRENVYAAGYLIVLVKWSLTY
jgi:hypothetical protein